MNNADAMPQEMRITRMCPQANWRQIWRNLTVALTSEDDKAVWYRTIHDILPKNERLHRIKISPTDKCNACGAEDSPASLIECGQGQLMWEWTQKVIARMLRTILERIPPAKPLDFAAPWCDTVGPSKIRNLSHNQTARTDFKRPNGLFSSSQVETISSARKTQESSEFLNGSRQHSLMATK